MDLTLRPAANFRFRGGVIAMAAAVAGVRRRAAGEVGRDGTRRDAPSSAPLGEGRREAAGQGLLRRDDAARSPRGAGLGAPSPPRAQRAPAGSPRRAGAPAPRPARGPGLSTPRTWWVSPGGKAAEVKGAQEERPAWSSQKARGQGRRKR